MILLIQTKYQSKVFFINQVMKVTDLINQLNSSKELNFELGLVLDKREKLIGVINNSDIIKGLNQLSNKDLNIIEIMNSSPVFVKDNLTTTEIIKEVKDKVIKRSQGLKSLTRYVPVVNDKNKVVNVIDIYTLIASQPVKNENVEVYGLGFVGLTLAASLSNSGHNVTGIDINSNLIDILNKGQVPIHEPGLSDLIINMRSSNKLRFYDEPPATKNKFYIVCVGTPIDSKGKADLSYLTNVLHLISKRLKKDDVVMLRSTVPVGTTRKLAKNILEKSGLLAGQDFFLSFTPERTVEGNAMKELKDLPQIVGGLTAKCSEISGAFWRTHSNVVVQADSLESSELVKLANNSFRDLTFAFSNALALLADKYNIDSNELIYLANEGYPRNNIARPSPGVGGYCLTKDPLLYASTDDKFPHAKLAKLGRLINEEISEYPLKVFNKYLKNKSLKACEMKILIIGLAFKGWPETNYLRGSNGLKLALSLKDKCHSLYVYDSLVNKEEFEKFGLKFKNINKISSLKFDAVFIMNNHPKNIKEDFLKSLSNKMVFIFDGWNQIDKRTAVGYKNIKYANLGYYSN